MNPFRLKLSPINAVNKSFVFREEIKLNIKKIVNMSARILLAILLNIIFLDTKKIQSLGWQPKIGIREGVIKTVKYLRANEWVFEVR